MKKYMAIALVIVCLLVVLPLAGCLGLSDNKKTTDQPTITSRVTALEKEADSQSKAINSINKQLDSIPTVGSADDALAAANKANKDIVTLQEEVTALTKEVNKLKTRVTELEAENETSGSSGNSNSSNIDEDRLIDSDRNLKLYLEKMSPDSDPFHLSDGGDDITFDLIVVNTEDDNHDFKLNLWIEPEDDVKVTEVDTGVTAHPHLGDWTMTRADWDGTANDGKINFTMDEGYFINDEDEEDLTIVIEVDADADTFWSFRWTIEETD